MASLTMIMDGDNCWPDLKDKMDKVIHLGNDAPPLQVALLDKGMASGRPSVTLRIDLPDGPCGCSRRRPGDSLRATPTYSWGTDMGRSGYQDAADIRRTGKVSMDVKTYTTGDRGSLDESPFGEYVSRDAYDGLAAERDEWKHDCGVQSDRLMAAIDRIRELEAALNSVRSILQSDSVEYDDMRHIDHIIDEAIAGDGDCQEHDWSWADAAGQQVCKRCGLRSPPSDSAEQGVDHGQ